MVLGAVTERPRARRCISVEELFFGNRALFQRGGGGGLVAGVPGNSAIAPKKAPRCQRAFTATDAGIRRPGCR